jgi:predicted dehydrogenase
VTDADDPYIDRWWPPGHIIGWEHTFVHENYEYLMALEEGRQFQPDFQAGLTVQRVTDAIGKSDDRGAWVEV